ncbi:Clp protease N-terminal domain-containing protein [Microbispora hainanensis]|uniref:Clp R domain-containing protein n=1 Tax=Microbispora hainanensis TaxID=568844 RepID=A0ABZ1T152_9ACTN|nr:Clp protease N-terminal domain-containing protein [Microbispora hainanensis]
MMPSSPTLESLIAQVRSGLENGPALDRLTLAVGLANRLGELGENLIGYYVDEARRDGASWAEIGTRLGVSRQAVQKRFIPSEAGMRGRGQEGFWDRASADLKTAVKLAREAAQARRKTYLGTEHLLLGLAGQPDQTTAQALARCGADPVTIRGAIDGRVGAPQSEPLPDETPFTRLALRALQHALREALLMNQANVGSEHLALGLLTIGEGIAHDVLINLGVSYERLREAVKEVTADPAAAAQSEQSVQPAPGRPEDGQS